MSVRKRTTKRGVRYVAVVDAPRDPVTGRRKQIKRTFRTAREAEAWERQVRVEIDRGEYLQPTKVTVAEYLPRWLAAAAHLRPSSRARYAQVIGRIAPALGSIPLAKLSALHIQDWYADLLACGLSPSTVALYHGVLHRALDQAVKWRLLRHNPCDAVETPRPRHPEMRTWTADEARAFLAATADHELAALWRLALTTGMRRGELLALRWQDIDLERRQLAVRRTLSRGTDGFYFSEPKTRAGKRSIALSESTVTALREHRRRQLERRLALGAAWHETDLVFDRGDGWVRYPRAVEGMFQRLVARLGLPRIRFHDLRHTAATLMLAEGVHPKIVQERLGHATISMTLDRYSHVTMDMQREAADRLDTLLGTM